MKALLLVTYLLGSFVLIGCQEGGSASETDVPVPATPINTDQPTPPSGDETSTVDEQPAEEPSTNEQPPEDPSVVPPTEEPPAEPPTTEPPVDETDNTGDTPTEEEQPSTSTWYKPGPFTTWQWQLTGTVNTSYGVEIYDIDLFDSPTSLINELHTKGIKVICYFSGGSYESWRDDADQFVANDLGNTLDGWPGERWLNITTNNVRNIMKARLDLAVTKGCDGVEPDNMDGYTNNPGVPINAQDQLNYNIFIANEAHARNLSVALKNDLDQVAALVDYFDFAINEQCFEYSECDMLKPFADAGKAILNAEYKSKWKNDAVARAALCTDAATAKTSTLVLPLDLNDNFRHSCL